LSPNPLLVGLVACHEQVCVWLVRLSSSCALVAGTMRHPGHARGPAFLDGRQFFMAHVLPHVPFFLIDFFYRNCQDLQTLPTAIYLLFSYIYIN
jgi:hypothetical protein